MFFSKELYGLGAELAASGGDGDVAEALGAGLGGWRRDYCGVEFFQEVLNGQYEEEVNDAGDEEKVDDRGEKVAVLDYAPVDVSNQIPKVLLADDGSQQRTDDLFSQRGDDSCECGSDDDSDSEIDDVATQNEIAESF
jgi:hypothetical protein